MLGVSQQYRMSFRVQVGTCGKRDRKDRDHREPTLAEAENVDGQRGDIPYPDNQQATPSPRLEGLTHIHYNPSHKIRCRVCRESRVKTYRGDGVVAGQGNWVTT